MSDRVRSHPVYASVYDRYNRSAERTWLGSSRRAALAHARGRVLEIGAGTGVNLLHYPQVAAEVTEIVLAEPDPAYRRRLARRIPHGHVPVSVSDAPAECLPFADATFDTVVSTLVMCSVDEPRRCATELRRVLRPDGVLVLIEHVQCGPSRWRRAYQHASVPFWRLFVGGCRPDRPTLATLGAAGFDVCELTRFHPPHVPSVMFPFVVATAAPAATGITSTRSAAMPS
jgi:ubiquinone/menaquinone biosynthesis C-methylase UbiE